MAEPQAWPGSGSAAAEDRLARDSAAARSHRPPESVEGHRASGKTAARAGIDAPPWALAAAALGGAVLGALASRLRGGRARRKSESEESHHSLGSWATSDDDEEDGEEGAAGAGTSRGRHASRPAAGGSLSSSHIDSASWGLFLGGAASQWQRRCEQAAEAGSGGPMGPCCKAALPGSLSGRHGLQAGGEDVLVVDYLLAPAVQAHAGHLPSLHRLLQRLIRHTFLKGNAGPRFRLYLATSDPCWGFVDAEGVPWFNAARDPVPPTAPDFSSLGLPAHDDDEIAGSDDDDSADGGSPRHAAAAGSGAGGADERERMRAWFLAGCHLVAHAFGATHGPAFQQQFGQVVLRYHSRLLRLLRSPPPEGEAGAGAAEGGHSADGEGHGHAEEGDGAAAKGSGPGAAGASNGAAGGGDSDPVPQLQARLSLPLAAPPAPLPVRAPTPPRSAWD